MSEEAQELKLSGSFWRSALWLKTLSLARQSSLPKCSLAVLPMGTTLVAEHGYVSGFKLWPHGPASLQSQHILQYFLVKLDTLRTYADF